MESSSYSSSSSTQQMTSSSYQSSTSAIQSSGAAAGAITSGASHLTITEVGRPVFTRTISGLNKRRKCDFSFSACFTVLTSFSFFLPVKAKPIFFGRELKIGFFQPETLRCLNVS